MLITKTILFLFIIITFIISFASCGTTNLISSNSDDISIINHDPIKDNSASEITIENPINFDEFKSKNTDICAWIKIPGIDVIDYPIVQDPNGLNSFFYLWHDCFKNEAKEGSIFIQLYNKNSFDDRNTVIYGNRMNDGTMFSQLNKFLDKTFFANNRTIYIYTPNHIFEYQIISAFIYDDRHILNSIETESFFNECLNPSSDENQIINNATLDMQNDKIITLSTNTENSAERLLVIGKLIGNTKTE